MLSTTGDFLRTYMDVVKPELLSYDFYQWWWGSEWYYSRLEVHRSAALAADIPLLVWIEANAAVSQESGGAGPAYLPDNQQRLRQSVYTSLAYGVKGIQWFVYSLIFGPGAELTRSGQDIAKINAELQVLGPTLMQLHSVDVFHTAPLPRDTRPLPPDYWVQCTGRDWVLGVLKDTAGADYLLVANRDWQRGRSALLQFPRGVRAVQSMAKRSGRWWDLELRENRGRQFVACAIGPGDGELLKVEQNQAGVSSK